MPPEAALLEMGDDRAADLGDYCRKCDACWLLQTMICPVPLEVQELPKEAEGNALMEGSWLASARRGSPNWGVGTRGKGVESGESVRLKRPRSAKADNRAWT